MKIEFVQEDYGDRKVLLRYTGEAPVTVAEAFAVTRVKWGILVNHGYKQDGVLILSNGRRTCGLCMLFSDPYGELGCSPNCPVVIYGQHAGCANTPFSEWGRKHTYELAQAALAYLDQVEEHYFKHIAQEAGP